MTSSLREKVRPVGLASVFAAACLGSLGCAEEAARCEETTRAVPWGAPLEDGPAPQTWFERHGGDFEGELQWLELPDTVEGTVPADPTTFTLTVEPRGDTADYIDAQRVGGDDDERLACSSTLRLPADVVLTTADGALDLRLSGRLYAWPESPDRIFGTLEFTADVNGGDASNAGTATFTPASPEDYDSRIASFLRFDLSDGKATGSIAMEAVVEAAEDERASMLPEFYAEIATFAGG